MSRILIKNGLIIDPANQIHAVGDLAIENGVIKAVLTMPDDFQADTVIDATNKIVSAGFIDLSSRLRDMGHSRKGTFKSETPAAAKGGFTSLCLQPDTQPANDTASIAEYIKDLAEKAGYPQIYPVAALTQRLDGSELSSMLALKQAGCIAVSNANQPVKNLLILRRAMEYAASHDLLYICRPNEFSLSNNGCAHEGAVASRYGLPSIPDSAETVALEQCLELAELTKCRVHFGQLSSRRAVIKLHQAKKYGLNVSADVAAHQLHLTEDDIEPFNSIYHVLPPLRTKADKNYLRQGLANGTINAICSDHQPHDLDAKLGAFPETEAGISTLETVLPLMLKLVAEQEISLEQGIAALTEQPAKILGLNAGALSVGFSADVCVFDDKQTWQVGSETWRSRGLNTPFWGHTLTGCVTHTIQAGKLIYSLD